MSDTLEFARLLRKNEAPRGVVLAETDTAPYVCRKTPPPSPPSWGVVGGLGLGVISVRNTTQVRAALEPFFPGLVTYPHALACGLGAMNPVIHPAGVLLNAGRIEHSPGDFYFYDAGVSPCVCRLICGVAAERRALGQALGSGPAPGS